MIMLIRANAKTQANGFITSVRCKMPAHLEILQSPLSRRSLFSGREVQV